MTTKGGAADLSLEEVLQRMEQTQKSIQNITFDYVMHARQGQFQGRTSGRVQLKKPSELKVTQSKPEKLVIVTDGTTLWLYSPKQQQVLKGDWKRWVVASKFPLTLMNFVGAFGASRWQDRYQGYLDGHDDHQYKVRFVNRIPDAEPPVTLWVSDESFLPTRGDIHPQGGFAAQVQIKAIQTNTQLTKTELWPHFPKETVEVPVPF